MFLQVKMPPEECRVLRFLWRSKPEDKIGVYEYTKQLFGAESSPTCANYAFLLGGVDNQVDHPIAAKAVKRNFFMDDFAKSVITVEAVYVYQDLRTTLRKGGFNLLKWVCNNEVVTRSIPEKDRREAKSKTFEAELHTSSLLSMQWNVNTDTLEACRGADKEVPNKITQRAVLLFVASIFDPLGLCAPFTTRMRILLETIWDKSGQQWDKQFEVEDEQKYLKWVRELAELENMPLKRRYFEKSYKKTDLHIFSDASLESMCIVAYVRAADGDGVELSFVIGKCRVVPKKQQTFPKLELQAALYSVRLRQMITEDHDIQIHTVTHWTDLLTVLQWLHSAHKKQQVLGASRVGEILDQSTVDTWRHVKGTINPADIGTRRVTVSQLLEREWLHGPAWLKQNPGSWPGQ